MRYLYYQKILMKLNAVSEEKDIALTKFYQESYLMTKPASICMACPVMDEF